MAEPQTAEGLLDLPGRGQAPDLMGWEADPENLLAMKNQLEIADRIPIGNGFRARLEINCIRSFPLHKFDKTDSREVRNAPQFHDCTCLKACQW